MLNKMKQRCHNAKGESIIHIHEMNNQPRPTTTQFYHDSGGTLASLTLTIQHRSHVTSNNDICQRQCHEGFS